MANATAFIQLNVPWSQNAESGGWIRFEVKTATGANHFYVVETLSLSAWDIKRNTGVGAWRTLFVPVPQGYTIVCDAQRGDVEVIKFEYLPA